MPQTLLPSVLYVALARCGQLHTKSKANPIKKDVLGVSKPRIVFDIYNMVDVLPDFLCFAGILPASFRTDLSRIGVRVRVVLCDVYPKSSLVSLGPQDEHTKNRFFHTVSYTS